MINHFFLFSQMYTLLSNTHSLSRGSLQQLKISVHFFKLVNLTQTTDPIKEERKMHGGKLIKYETKDENRGWY